MTAVDKFFDIFERISGSKRLGYGVAVVGTAGAAWLRWELGRLLGQDLPPYITFYPVIILSALFGGTRAGVLATVMATAVVDYLFLRPAGFGIERPVDMAGLAIFTVLNLMLSVMGGALREAHLRTQKQARNLANTVDLLDLANVCACDLDQRIIRWNTGCQKLYGFTREQALGKISHELLHTRFPEPLEAIQAKVLEYGRWEGELGQTDNCGREHVVACEWLLRQEASSGASILIEVNTDVTERKTAEDLLRSNEERFRTLVEVTNQVVWITTPGGEPTADSSSWREFTGRTSEQWTGWRWLEAIHPEDRQRVAASWRHALEHVQSHSDEYRLLHASGSYRHVHVHTVPVRTVDGKVREWIGTLNDITERTRAENALRESENRYRTLFEAIDEGFCVLEMMFDDDGTPNNWRYLEVNPASERHSGLEQTVGKTMLELAPDIETTWFNLYGKVAVTGQPVRLVEFSQALNRWFDLYAFRIGKPSENKVAVLFVNITERKNNEEALLQARNELTQANAKLEYMVQKRTVQLQETVDELEHFSYTLTHDMRAPLRAMRGFTQLLQEGASAKALDAAAKAHLERIKMSASRMDAMITDALQYSWALRGVFSIRPVDVATLLRDMLESYPELHPPHAQIDLDGKFPLVLANEAGLTQCFSNLLGNAVKFVAPGTEPRVRVRAETRGDFVRLWVEDNGTGIPKEYHERIWVMFQRLGEAFEGTGVGLAIVRKIVYRMGGRVGVESEPGAGSQFWIELKGVNRNHKP